ncbi:MAG: PAS domain-containing protein [Rhodospirillaceae bacterium]|nr:PAS domain-containing protein [Rhodospirillaceae bacterium]
MPLAAGRIMPQASGADFKLTATFDEALAGVSDTARAWMSYWRSLAPPGVLPRRDQLDPSALLRILPSMSITERENSDTLWLRLVGSGIVARMGTDTTGKNILEVHIQTQRQVLRAHLNFVLDRPCGQIVRLVDTDTSGQRLAIDLCRLPMADRDGAPRFIVGTADSPFLWSVRPQSPVETDVQETVFFALPGTVPDPA